MTAGVAVAEALARFDESLVRPAGDGQAVVGLVEGHGIFGVLGSETAGETRQRRETLFGQSRREHVSPRGRIEPVEDGRIGDGAPSFERGGAGQHGRSAFGRAVNDAAGQTRILRRQLKGRGQRVRAGHEADFDIAGRQRARAAAGADFVAGTVERGEGTVRR